MLTSLFKPLFFTFPYKAPCNFGHVAHPCGSGLYALPSIFLSTRSRQPVRLIILWLLFTECFSGKCMVPALLRGHLCLRTEVLSQIQMLVPLHWCIRSDRGQKGLYSGERVLESGRYYAKCLCRCVPLCHFFDSRVPTWSHICIFLRECEGNLFYFCCHGGLLYPDGFGP